MQRSACLDCTHEHRSTGQDHNDRIEDQQQNNGSFHEHPYDPQFPKHAFDCLQHRYGQRYRGNDLGEGGEGAVRQMRRKGEEREEDGEEEAGRCGEGERRFQDLWVGRGIRLEFFGLLMGSWRDL